MDQGVQHYEKDEPDPQLRIVGVFSCLYCGRRFSTKHHLKGHYRKTHQKGIPNYKGKKQSISKRATQVQNVVDRITLYCYDIPSSSSQLIILLILALIYYGS